MAGKRKPPDAPEGLPGWMGTYGDLVTLLLCFFILLYASSDVDVAKFQSIAKSFNENITVIDGGGSLGDNDMLGSGIMELPELDKSINDSVNEENQEENEELEKLASDFKTYFAENNLQDQIEVEVMDDYVKITFGDGVLFDSGRADLKESSIEILSMIAIELQNYTDSDIKIEGHSDNVPIKSVVYPSNMHLSAARSISVLEYFKDVQNISPSRLSQSGFGEYRPVASNDTPEGRAKNRRVELKVMSSFASGSN